MNMKSESILFIICIFSSISLYASNGYSFLLGISQVPHFGPYFGHNTELSSEQESRLFSFKSPSPMVNLGASAYWYINRDIMISNNNEIGLSMGTFKDQVETEYLYGKVESDLNMGYRFAPFLSVYAGPKYIGNIISGEYKQETIHLETEEEIDDYTYFDSGIGGGLGASLSHTIGNYLFNYNTSYALIPTHMNQSYDLDGSMEAASVRYMIHYYANKISVGYFFASSKSVFQGGVKIKYYSYKLQEEESIFNNEGRNTYLIVFPYIGFTKIY